MFVSRCKRAASALHRNSHNTIHPGLAECMRCACNKRMLCRMAAIAVADSARRGIAALLCWYSRKRIPRPTTFSHTQPHTTHNKQRPMHKHSRNSDSYSCRWKCAGICSTLALHLLSCNEMHKITCTCN